MICLYSCIFEWKGYRSKYIWYWSVKKSERPIPYIYTNILANEIWKLYDEEEARHYKTKKDQSYTYNNGWSEEKWHGYATSWGVCMYKRVDWGHMGMFVCIGERMQLYEC